MSIDNKYIRLSELPGDGSLEATAHAKYPGQHCSFRAVAGTVPLIKNSYALLFGPAICLYNAKLSMNMRSLTSDPRPNNLLFVNYSQDDIIFGFQEKVREAIHQADQEYHPEVLFLITSCLQEIVGEDFDACIDETRPSVKAKLLTIHTENFTCEDSTCLLMNGKSVPTILDTLRTKATAVSLEDMVYPGFAGVLCAECGGPTPGVGCAGRGIIASFEKLEALKAYETYRPDIVLYDVLGDVVCGGFAMPLRRGYADEVYIVTSGEKMSLFAARNIAQAVGEFKGRGYAQLKGIILNARGIADELEIVRRAAAEMDTKVVAEIPRDPTIQACEERNATVIEGAPDSSLAERYRMLARSIMG